MTSLGRNKDAEQQDWEHYEYTPRHVTRVGSNYAIKTMSFGNRIDKAGIKTHNDVCSDELAQMMAVWGVCFMTWPASLQRYFFFYLGFFLLCCGHLFPISHLLGSAMCAEKRIVSEMIQNTYGTLTRIIFDQIYRASTEVGWVED
jgi:hypothetical protein